ncbi:ankyrin repeat-containing domain protein, partial [Ampelomyces quisqualis]
LVESGADVNARGGEYGTALLPAAVRGDRTITKLLLNAGANPNLTGGFYHTPLQDAYRRGYYTNTAHVMIFAGADINKVAGKIGTAITAAAFIGDMELFESLLENGAD